jgi:hypothetical protein
MARGIAYMGDCSVFEGTTFVKTRSAGEKH